jgi:hypothetical protein
MKRETQTKLSNLGYHKAGKDIYVSRETGNQINRNFQKSGIILWVRKSFANGKIDVVADTIEDLLDKIESE